MTVLYCLPFLGAYLFLKNQASLDWVINVILALFWLIMVLDWISFSIVLPLGATLGSLYYYFEEGSFTLQAENLQQAFIHITFAIVTSLVFSHRREKDYLTKLATMKAVAGAVAHEMRTPLHSISSISQGLSQHLPALIKTYAIAKEQRLEIPEISKNHIRFLPKIAQSLATTCKSASTFIDMLLMNLREEEKIGTLHPCSIHQCITQALQAYPLTEKEAQLIDYQPDKDFIFQGEEQLMIHVLFNLLKNALHYVKAANKGRIHIWLEEMPQGNRLHFKDTGQGIPADVLPHVFDRFYTQTPHGTGIGLAFCKLVMKRFNGQITCNSVWGEYTEFILQFPEVPERREAETFKDKP